MSKFRVLTTYLTYEQQHCSKIQNSILKKSRPPMDTEMESSNLCKYPEGDFKLTNPRARGCFNKGLFCGFWLDRFLSAWWVHHTAISQKWRHRCHVLITPNPLTSPTYYHNKFGPRSCTLFQRFFFLISKKKVFTTFILDIYLRKFSKHAITEFRHEDLTGSISSAHELFLKV